jgi:transcription antitermination factor NusG
MALKKDTPRWYAVYTKSRTEKKLATELEEKGIEVYLPLLKTLKQWSDRKKWVEEPLFRSYLFVRIYDKNYLDVLQTDGAVRFITFRHERIPVPDAQIEAVKAFLNDEERISTTETDYHPGDLVEIIRGPMRGLLGTLVEVKGKQRVMIEIESIGQRLMINVPKSMLEQRNKQ